MSRFISFGGAKIKFVIIDRGYSFSKRHFISGSTIRDIIQGETSGMKSQEEIAEQLREAYPHVADAAEAIVPIIKAVERRRNPELAELEVRIGVFRGPEGKEHFVPGVDGTFMSRMLCKLETCTTWKHVTPWRQQVDRYYLLPSGLQARSSMEVVAGSLETSASTPSPPLEPKCAVSHIIKTEIAHQDFAWHVVDQSCMSAICNEDGAPYCIRDNCFHL
jgi:hypothetical protein